jgi:hypothetical protein
MAHISQPEQKEFCEVASPLFTNHRQLVDEGVTNPGSVAGYLD